DPILWLSISSPIERNQFIRWLLDWLPAGAPRPCLFRLHNLTKKHAIYRLYIHSQLYM
ncbi:MAG: hypothetical protein EXX96DRAFT_465928, partial [Benjaminiella poitrasii]